MSSCRLVLYLLFFSFLILPAELLAGTKTINQPIVLGQSCALTGPAKNLGIEFRGGMLAAISKINDEGGVRGREIRLISEDDGYEPDRAIRNTYKLIKEDRVFMLAGQVGTPTAKAVIPLTEGSKVPLFAPFTGADLLRTPFRKYIINLRASYTQEMEHLAHYLVDKKKLKRIACFYQNDSYGFDGLRGIEEALKRRGMELVSKGSYERNTVAVMGGLQEIFLEDPEAVVLVGAYSACAEFIKLSKNRGANELIFCNISFVGTESLREALGGYGANVIISQVVPLPTDTNIPLIREYQRAMKAYQHDVPLSFTSLEGYISGKLFASIARAVPGVLSRDTFIETMQQVGRFDLGGVVLQFGPNDHQGMDVIHLTRIFPEIEELYE